MQFLVIRNLYSEVEKVPFIKESERNPKIFIKYLFSKKCNLKFLWQELALADKSILTLSFKN
uniref:Uncharacterized protein n=1 Tax=Rhizophagus irregularis (strain DAOM 181602 / DAOM 197198 / MUCL 43194) TaxID=747089 RepID=U9TDL6_RHIID